MKREYPEHPLVGVGGVVIAGNRVLLIRRGREPLKGKWSIPGGMVELGESLAEGARREIWEETGLHVEPLEVISVFDRIQKNGSRVQFHYVIVDYLCRRTGGRLKAGSDVLDARWVKRDDLPNYHLTRKAASLIAAAFRSAEKTGKPGLPRGKIKQVL
jgi:8-oxo-dGTP diphosphatase